MSGPAPAPDGLGALAEKEREILRLLVRGHTAKSIAAKLGRSEAAINERLREARRKTGVGSSRELARIVAAQENRDEKIDLIAAAASAEAEGRPQAVRPVPAKGSQTMLQLTALGAAAALLASPAFPGKSDLTPAADTAAPAAASLLVGRWALDVARIPAEERPRSVTIAFAQGADARWTTQVRIVAPGGTASEAVSTAAADGVAVPVTGMGSIDSASLRHPSPNSLVMTLAKDGKPVSTRVYTVAADGRTMTETIVWAGQAVPKLETTHFTRID